MVLPPVNDRVLPLPSALDPADTATPPADVDAELPLATATAPLGPPLAAPDATLTRPDDSSDASERTMTDSPGALAMTSPPVVPTVTRLDPAASRMSTTPWAVPPLPACTTTEPPSPVPLPPEIRVAPPAA